LQNPFSKYLFLLVPPARIEPVAQGFGIVSGAIGQDAGEAFTNRVFPVFSLDCDNFSTLDFVSFC
jgi:hypothetical protein